MEYKIGFFSLLETVHDYTSTNQYSIMSLQKRVKVIFGTYRVSGSRLHLTDLYFNTS